MTLLNHNARDQYDAKLGMLHKRQLKNARSAGYSLAGGGAVSVGEGSELTRQFIGIMSVILAGFIIMAAVAYRLDWIHLRHEESANTAASPEPAPAIAKQVLPRAAPRVVQPEPPKVAVAPAILPTAPLTDITNSIGMKLQLIPAGNFTMGSPDSEKGYTEREQQHPVRITKAFFLGKYEVTQGEWQAVIDSKPWKGRDNVKEGDDYPATYVSWEDAVNFCKRLSRKEGIGYRLPTEAEWEYACRGHSATRFHFGDDEGKLGEHAWYDKNAAAAGERYAHRVGLKRANSFGLHDLHGNVSEWCNDWFDAKYYSKSPADNPQGSVAGLYRVLRSGCWFNGSVECRSAMRHWSSPSSRDKNLGFRLARDR